jgi:hypothetical protein
LAEDTFRQTYKALSPDKTWNMGNIKSIAADLYEALEGVPYGREKSAAQLRLEECVMWAVKGITA